jgi:hypothetical protein
MQRPSIHNSATWVGAEVRAEQPIRRPGCWFTHRPGRWPIAVTLSPASCIAHRRSAGHPRNLLHHVWPRSAPHRVPQTLVRKTETEIIRLRHAGSRSEVRFVVDCQIKIRADSKCAVDGAGRNRSWHHRKHLAFALMQCTLTFVSSA